MNCAIDVYAIAQLFWINGSIKCKDVKLSSVCKAVGINLEDAHDASADIRATKELFEYFQERFEIKA
jgi:DNA polymerase III alpha subunit (gram-positive type)